MKTQVILGLVALLTVLKSSASECWIIGQDPADPSSFNKLITHEADVNFDTKGKILYSDNQFFVSYHSDGPKIGLTTGKANPSKLSAMATGGINEIQLVDANLKISVYCRK